MEIIIYAVLAGFALALSLTSLGSIIAWKRTSYLSDSIAHSSLLGLSLSTLYHTNPNLTIIPICFLFAFALVYLNSRLNLAKDSIVVFNTQISLALSLIIISLFINQPITNFFFGSILAVNLRDIIYIYIIAVFTLGYLFFNWDRIILSTINEDIAKSEGINTFLLEVVLIFILSATVSFAIKIAGVLLIPSLMILPNMIGSRLAHNPFYNLLISISISFICIVLGIVTSIFIDVATAPLITVYLALMILLSLLKTRKVSV